MNRRFAIAGAGPLALIFLMLPCVLLLFATFYVLAIEGPPAFNQLVVAVLMGLGALAFVWFAVAQSHSFLEIGADTLHLRVPFQSKRIPLSKIDPEGIERVDLQASPDYRLTWRTLGVGLPGYKLGWFRTKGRGKVLAAISDPVVVAVPVGDDYTLLASIDGIAAFKQALVRAIEAQRQ